MTFTTRLCVFTVLAVAGIVAWQWQSAAETAHEATQLAVQQFRNDAAVPANLQQASLAQNWQPLIWPALVLLLAGVMFWDDLEHWWKQEQV